MFFRSRLVPMQRGKMMTKSRIVESLAYFSSAGNRETSWRILFWILYTVVVPWDPEHPEKMGNIYQNSVHTAVAIIFRTEFWHFARG